MPTKILSSQTSNKGPQDLFSFGGGADTIFANADNFSPFGYVIDGGGGDDAIYGSDFIGDPNLVDLIVFNPLTDNLNTEFGDLLFGGDGADTIIGGAGNDTIYAGDANGNDALKGKEPTGSNFLVGDGERQADGSLTANMSFTQSSSFTGSNDMLFGSQVFTRMRGDADIVTFSDDTFVGGNDTLTAGSGGSNMIGDASTIGGTGTITGGDDILISGSGNDQMFGDWSSSAGFTGVKTGGADTFVFAQNFGFDSIGDFDSQADKAASGDPANFKTDLINLAATGLTWADLDNVADGVLSADDFGVTVNFGHTQIDFFVLTGGDFDGFLTVTGEAALVEADFDFTAMLV